MTAMNRILCESWIKRTFCGLIISIALAIPIDPVMAQGNVDKEIEDELAFAAALVKNRFPDYAEKVAKALVEKYPSAKDRVVMVQIMSLLERGKFDEAEILFKQVPAESKDALRLRLDFGDYYYAWGKLNKARDSYGIFFKGFPNGPPPELKEMYGDTAYKYAQMLLGKGDDKGAIEAYRYILLSNPEEDVRLQILMEMAELCLKVGTVTKGDERTKFLQEAYKLCNEVQWKGAGSIQFGKSVVVMAHIKLTEGDKTAAKKVVEDYMPMLKQIDDILRKEKQPMRASPMAQCRFLLGTIAEETGRMQFESNNIAGGKKLLAEALQHYYVVVIKYPTSNWAGDAGQRAEDIVTYLQSKKVTITGLPKIDRNEVTSTQFKEAKTLFQEQNYSEAIPKYVEVISAFPGYKSIITAMGELAQCYAQQKNVLFADVVISYIAERYGSKEASREEAGYAVLGVISAFESQGEVDAAKKANQLFMDRIPTHSQTPLIIFRTAESKLREEKFAEARAYYANIVSNYPKARMYPDALNRKAACESKLGDYTNLITTIQAYMKELVPSHALVAATYQLADAYRMTDQGVLAINEYSKVISMILNEGAKYGQTPEDVAKNHKVLEPALFHKASCYSRLRKPEDKVPLFQAKAVEGYQAFLKEFPKSEQLAPVALSGMGTLLFILNKPEEANRTYELLSRDYPNSAQASNIVYAQGKALLDIGQTDKAIEVFGKMLANPKSFTPSQFMLVSRTMLEAKQYEIAIKFFEQNRKASERNLWEAAMIGIAQASVELKKYTEAAAAAEELLAKYTNSGYTVDGNFILSRSYAEIGQKAGEKEKSTYFNKAIKAMNRVRKLSRDPQVRARADFELVTLQILMGKKREAIASLMRTLMFGDVNNPAIQHYIEESFMKALPLLNEAEMHVDILEQCEKHLNDFPQGKYVSQARKWRNDMRMRGVRTAGEAADKDAEPVVPPNGAAAVTNVAATSNSPQVMSAPTNGIK